MKYTCWMTSYPSPFDVNIQCLYMPNVYADCLSPMIVLIYFIHIIHKIFVIISIITKLCSNKLWFTFVSVGDRHYCYQKVKIVGCAKQNVSEWKIGNYSWITLVTFLHLCYESSSHSGDFLWYHYFSALLSSCVNHSVSFQSWVVLKY